MPTSIDVRQAAMNASMKFAEQRGIDVQIYPTEKKPRQVSILIQYRIRGLHVHCRIFSGFLGGTRGNAGEMILRKEEFSAYKTTLEEIGRGLIPNSAPAVFEFQNADPTS